MDLTQNKILFYLNNPICLPSFPSAINQMISQYYKQFPSPINFYTHPHDFITSQIYTIYFLENFINQIKPIYHSSNGNLPIFIKNIDTLSPFHVPIFHILIGYNTYVKNIIFFSYWDRLMAQLILAWYDIMDLYLSLDDLFIHIDQLNLQSN